jgi:hypothetical protein
MVEHFCDLSTHQLMPPKSTTEGRHGLDTCHAISTKVAQLQPALISNGGASPGVAVQGAKEGRQGQQEEAQTAPPGGHNRR